MGVKLGKEERRKSLLRIKDSMLGDKKPKITKKKIDKINPLTTKKFSPMWLPYVIKVGMMCASQSIWVPGSSQPGNRFFSLGPCTVATSLWPLYGDIKWVKSTTWEFIYLPGKIIKKAVGRFANF